MKILCADSLADDLLAPLREAGHVVVVEPDLTADTIPERLADGDFEVLVVRSTKVTAAAFDASNALGLVVRAGAGTDNIDKQAASARGVYVSNVPGRNAVAVAELTMALLLARGPETDIGAWSVSGWDVACLLVLIVAVVAINVLHSQALRGEDGPSTGRTTTSKGSR